MAPARPRALRDVLTEVLGGLRLGDPAEARLFAAWPRLVGEAAARASRIEKLEGGRLTVATESSVWGYELTMKRESLRKTLNEFLGTDAVKEVTVRQGTRRGR